MVKHYADLPDYSTFLSSFSLAFSNLHNDKSKLTSFQQLCVVLMKFCLDLGDQDLGFRFGVDHCTISQYVKNNYKHTACSVEATCKMAREARTNKNHAFLIFGKSLGGT